MEFDNLHQILRSLYEQMMPLCADMAGVAKGIAGLGALFYVAYRVWQSFGESRTDRRLPDAPPICHRSVHHVLPYGGAWHDKQRPLARRAGHGETARNADAGHEQVPGAEGQAGIRGDGAQSRNRLPRVQRGV